VWAGDAGILEQGLIDRRVGGPGAIGHQQRDQVRRQGRALGHAQHLARRDLRVVQQGFPDRAAKAPLESNALGQGALARESVALRQIEVADALVDVAGAARVRIGLGPSRRGGPRDVSSHRHAGRAAARGRDEAPQGLLGGGVEAHEGQAGAARRSRIEPDRFGSQPMRVSAVRMLDAQGAEIPLGKAGGTGHERSALPEVVLEIQLELLCARVRQY
jgi:hypothetical protein